jgi:hypothetical protein
MILTSFFISWVDGPEIHIIKKKVFNYEIQIQKMYVYPYFDVFDSIGRLLHLL